MKRSKKLLALLLSVLMTASLFPVAVFAEDTDPYAALREGTGYVALGDSFTRGYGAGGRWQDQIYLNDTYGNFACRNVDGSYPNRVAEAFGLYAPDDIRDTDAKLWPLAHDAVSTAYMLDRLGADDGYRDEEFTYAKSYRTERYETDLAYFGDPESLTLDGKSVYGETGEIMSVRELIKNASLITVGLGQTDVIYKAQIFGLDSLDLSDIKALPGGVANIVKLLYNYFDYWKGAYPLLLDFIKENNPTAKVVLIGTLNPIKDATLKDDGLLPIGSAINIIMDLMNAYTKQCALKYGYTFIDISDVETPASVTKMSIGHILSISDATEYALIAHPTPNGYAQIAERIITAVEKDLNRDSGAGGFFAAIVAWFKAFFEKIAALFGGFAG